MRTIRIEATGVDAGSIQAPDFVLGQAIAIKQASRRYNRLAGDWNVGVLEVTWSLLPRRAGVLQVLPYRIDWWDVVNGVSKSAALEGRTIVVGNPSGSAVNGRWPLAEANTLAASLESKEARWRVPLVLAVITATVAFLSGWMWRSSLPWRRLRIACLGGSAANAEKALLAFLAVRNRFPRTLGEVCRTVNDDFLLRPVRELERTRYGHAGTSWDGRNLVARSWKLRRAFVRGLAHGSTGIRAGE